MSVEILVAILLAVLSPSLAWWFGRRKSQAEINSLLIDSARDLLDNYRTQASDLQLQVERLRAEVESLRQDQAALDGVVNNANELALRAQLGVMILVGQLVEANLTPLITSQSLTGMTTAELRQKVRELQND